ncbi:hypothetical protein BT93_J0188 [Corymbia citriodora subsp. variegata]|nr:hypothetical protein BT93_J0188 [Corymbia citriodora subsp. variegata]
MFSPGSPPSASPERSPSVSAVEAILNYEFKTPALLEEALTHPSIPNATSYQRLEFLGDKVLNLVAGDHLFRAHPELDQGQLTKLVWVNVSTEKLARVAVRHRLYRFLKKQNVEAMDDAVDKFATAVLKEDDDALHGGLVKAPKVLADIVESVAGAMFKDNDSDLKGYEGFFTGLLEPIFGPEELKQHPHPISTLNELYQGLGKDFRIETEEKGSTIEAKVYVDGEDVASYSSEDTRSARLGAARTCLSEYEQPADDPLEIVEAKKKLNELCDQKKWSRKYETEPSDPLHGKGYACTVVVVTGDGVPHSEKGEKRRSKLEAERCAAYRMWLALTQSNNESPPSERAKECEEKRFANSLQQLHPEDNPSPCLALSVL